jgi:hypothetical protein
MTSGEVLRHEATRAAVALIISGFISVTMRRHLVFNLLGVSLVVLGSAILICELPPVRGRWTAAILIISASLMTPIGLIAMARWRVIRDSSSRSTLQESVEHEERPEIGVALPPDASTETSTVDRQWSFAGIIAAPFAFLENMIEGLFNGVFGLLSPNSHGTERRVPTPATIIFVAAVAAAAVFLSILRSGGVAP